jgi:hypothetical protein
VPGGGDRPEEERQDDPESPRPEEAEADEELEVDWDTKLPPLEESRTTPEELAGRRPAARPLQSAPAWTQPELAWPLALVAGFVGSTLGIRTGIPGTGALLALGLFSPLYLGLFGRGRIRLAALISIGWMAAVGAAAAGSVLDGSFNEVARACPGAHSFRDLEIRTWIEGERSGPETWPLLRNLALTLLLLAAARPTRGFLTLLGLGVAASAVGCGVGWFAEAADTMDPAMACLFGIPPHCVFVLCGVALSGVALAERRPWIPAPGGGDQRRALIVAGLALAAAGLFLEPLLAATWGSWMAQAVG